MINREVFALEECLERVESDTQFLIELIEGFLISVPQQLNDLRGSIDKSDLPTAQRQAHTLKGALKNLGAERCGAVALRLENAAREGGLKDSEAMISELEALIKEYEDAFREFKTQEGGMAVS